MSSERVSWDRVRAAAVSRGEVDQSSTVRANRRWWDAEAHAYHLEHGSFLGEADFVWCPERLREAQVHLLGAVAGLHGRRVVEVGCGAAMCSRWLAAQGVDVVAVDLSAGMLNEAVAQNTRTGIGVPLLQADATALPLRSASVHVAFSAYGAVPFVADSAALMAEVARVLRPGGRWVFATSHPVRWAFPDDPGPDGLVAGAGGTGYFDRRPYVEIDDAQDPVYAEHHRTLGDRVRELTSAGLVLDDLVEPEWPPEHEASWGAWSPLRGAVLPGTAIFCSRKPGAA